jgi:hypothetical protein
MPMSDQDWAIIDDIFSRIPSFNESSRDAFLLRIPNSPAQKNAIETKVSKILGHQDFYVTLKDFVRSSGDEGLEQRTLKSMSNYVINDKDRVFLERLIQEKFDEPIRPEPQPPTPKPQDSLMKQCQALFIAKEWPKLLDLLDQRTQQMGNTKRASNLQNSVVIFRSDYESIRSQSRDGLVSTDEEKRLLAALWNRVLILLEDIERDL